MVCYLTDRFSACNGFNIFVNVDHLKLRNSNLIFNGFVSFLAKKLFDEKVKFEKLKILHIFVQCPAIENVIPQFCDIFLIVAQ